MSTGTLPFSSDEEQQELNPLVKIEPKKQDGPIRCALLSLDDHVNVKMLMRQWRPRFEFFVRMMLVATFLDDSFRILTNFPELIHQVVQDEGLKWASTQTTELANIIAITALSFGFLAQSLGSICLLTLRQTDVATKALITWVVVQPLIFAQLSNFEFLAESLSLFGGLLLLRAQLISDRSYRAGIQLCGRLFVPTAYLYHAGQVLFSSILLNETSNLSMYISSLSMFAIHMAVIVGLAIGSVLIAAGLKSRAVALLLAVANIGYVCYQHPFFLFVFLEDGEWKYTVDRMSIPALPANVYPSDVEPVQLYDLHRYYFFLGLSISGSLLLLAQVGPGQMAVQNDECLLPVVARAQD